MTFVRLFQPWTPVRARWVRGLFLAQAALAIAAWAASGARGLPTPLDVARAWWDLALHQDLLPELWTSVKTGLEALAVSTAAGVAVAALGTAPAFAPLARLSSSLRFLGFAGLTYLFMRLSSGGEGLRVSLLAFGMFVFLVTGLQAALADVPREAVDHLRTLGMRSWRITAELLLAQADHTLDLVRQNAAVGWTLLTLVEGLTRAQGGIGALLLNQNRYFLLAGVFALQLTILAYGLLQDAALAHLRFVLCPHARLGREAGASS